MNIKEIIYALKVCKKYNITWNPFFGMKYALCTTRYSVNKRWVKFTITMNPFYCGGIDTFLHEVGHAVYNKKVYMKSKSVVEYEMTKEDFMKEEYLAWRFAKLARKGLFGSNRARDMFKTYFPSYARKVGIFVALDRYSRYDRNLAK